MNAQLWVTAASSVATFVLGVVAAIVAFKTLKQKRKADQRAEFWRRLESVKADVTSDDVNRHRVAIVMLDHLSRDEDRQPNDMAMLEELTEAFIDIVAEFNPSPELPNGSTRMDEQGGLQRRKWRWKRVSSNAHR